MFSASLGEIASCGDTEFGGKRLKEHGDEAAEENDAEQCVTKFGTAADVGGPIAGVHVADSDEIAGAGEGKHLSPEGSVRENGNGAMRFGERRESRRSCRSVRG